MTRLTILAALIATPLAAATLMAPREVHPFLEWGVADIEYMMVIEAEDGRTAFRRIGPDECLAKYEDGPIACEDIDFSFAPPEALLVTGSLLPPGESLRLVGNPSGPSSPGGSFSPPPINPINPINPIPVPPSGLLLISALAAFLYWRKLT